MNFMSSNEFHVPCTNIVCGNKAANFTIHSLYNLTTMHWRSFKLPNLSALLLNFINKSTLAPIRINELIWHRSPVWRQIRISKNMQNATTALFCVWFVIMRWISWTQKFLQIKTPQRQFFIRTHCKQVNWMILIVKQFVKLFMLCTKHHNENVKPLLRHCIRFIMSFKNHF